MHIRHLLAVPLILIAGTAHAATRPMCEISGVVKDQSGNPVDGGVVKLFDEETLHQSASGIATKDDPALSAIAGRFRLVSAPCGDKYTIQAESRGFQATTINALKLTQAATTIDLVLYPAGLFSDQKYFTLFLIAIFLLSIFLFRWNNIAVFDQKLLLAEVAATHARLEIESDPDQLNGPTGKELRAVLDQAKRPFEKFHFLSLVFWTRGDEISSWTLVREVQRQMIALWPNTSDERLRARLETAEQDLIATGCAPALVLADLIKQTLLLPSSSEQYVERWKQLLSESLGYLNNRNEDEFARLTIWQSKTMWLALVACALIQASVAAKGSAFLMLMGAAGGLLSRLGRALHSTNAPRDYGASWTTLFLSPLLGALSGWFGILLADGFVHLNILSREVGANVDFQRQTLTTLALAFVLGFSERFFDSLVNAVNGKLLPGQAADNKPVVTTAKAPAAAPDGVVVKPSILVPGGKATISGSALDEANVTGITISQKGTTVSQPKIDYQDSGSIQFTVPPAAAPGKFTLSLSAKNRANPLTIIQIGAAAAPYSLDAVPNPLPPDAAVKLAGKSLDSLTFDLLDSSGNKVDLGGLVQTEPSLEFHAPTVEGEYILVAKDKTGEIVVRRKFAVKKA